VHHNSLQPSKLSFRFLSPMYLCAGSSSSGSKHIYIIRLRCAQSFISFLCATCHLARVVFKTTSITNILCCSSTYNSNDFINIHILFSPSYLGGSHSSIPTQCKDWVIRAHRLVDTSCILYCQFSRRDFEYDVHELIFLQISAPSIVGST
jgi:hypothetical protein